MDIFQRIQNEEIEQETNNNLPNSLYKNSNLHEFQQNINNNQNQQFQQQQKQQQIYGKNQLLIKCEQFQNGCPQILPYNFEQIQQHEHDCEYQSETCPRKFIGCQWHGIKRDLLQHERNCDFIKNSCSFCDQMCCPKVTYSKPELMIHHNTCQNKKILNFHQELKNKYAEVLKNSHNGHEIVAYQNIQKALQKQKDQIINLNLENQKKGITNQNIYQNNKINKGSYFQLLSVFQDYSNNLNTIQQQQQKSNSIDNLNLQNLQSISNQLNTNSIQEE